jgi:hypothetical protein
VLGNPRVRLGDAVSVQDAPAAPLNATFKVTGVRHHFSKSRGHVTIVDVIAMAGGAAGAAGAVGAVGAAAAGALGGLR